MNDFHRIFVAFLQVLIVVLLAFMAFFVILTATQWSF